MLHPPHEMRWVNCFKGLTPDKTQNISASVQPVRRSGGLAQLLPTRDANVDPRIALVDGTRRREQLNQ